MAIPYSEAVWLLTGQLVPETEVGPLIFLAVFTFTSSE